MANRPDPVRLSEPSRVFTDPDSAHPFETVKVLRDRVIAASKDRVSVWSRDDGALLSSAPHAPAEGMPSLSPDGQVLLLARRGGAKVSGDFSSLSLWRWARGGEPEDADDVPGVIGADLLVSPGGAHIAIRGYSLQRSGYYVWLCDGDANKRLRYPAFERGPLEPLFERLMREAKAKCTALGGLALSDDLLAISEKSVVLVFALPNLTPVRQMKLRGAGSLCFGPEGSLLATTSAGAVHAFDAEGRERWKTPLRRGTLHWIVTGGDRVLVNNANTVLSARDGAPIAVLNTPFSAVALSPDGLEAATGPFDSPGIVRLWDLPHGEIQRPTGAGP